MGGAGIEFYFYRDSSYSYIFLLIFPTSHVRPAWEAAMQDQHLVSGAKARRRAKAKVMALRLPSFFFCATQLATSEKHRGGSTGRCSEVLRLLRTRCPFPPFSGRGVLRSATVFSGVSTADVPISGRRKEFGCATEQAPCCQPGAPRAGF